MIQKRPYFRPLIEIVELDATISIQMTTPETPPVGPQPAAGESTTSSFKEVDDSGFKEDPFAR